MCIIIKNENNEYVLYTVSHTPYNLTPFTNPNAIQFLSCSMKIGKLKKLHGLKLNKEYYNLDCYKDFKIVERIKHNSDSYDFLTFDINSKSEGWNHYKNIIRKSKLKDILSC